MIQNVKFNNLIQMNQQIKSFISQKMDSSHFCSVMDCTKDIQQINARQLRQAFIQMYKNHFKQFQLLCLVTLQINTQSIIRYVLYSQILQGKTQAHNKDGKVIQFGKDDIKQLIIMALFDHYISFEECLQRMQFSDNNKKKRYQNKFAMRTTIYHKQKQQQSPKTQRKQMKSRKNTQKPQSKVVLPSSQISQKQITKMPLKKMAQKQEKKQPVLTSYHIEQSKLNQTKPEKKGMNRMDIKEFHKLFENQTQSQTQSESVKELFKKMADKQAKQSKQQTLSQIKQKAMVYDNSDEQDQALLEKMDAIENNKNIEPKNTQKSASSSQNISAKSKQKLIVGLQFKQGGLGKWLAGSK